MRFSRPRRALALLALAVTAITCTDAPTAPARGAASARIGLSPQFSAAASRAYEGLARLGFDIASVRVRLTSLAGQIAMDTVVSFPATQDVLTLDLSVQIEGTEQTFTALIELRDATGRRLFSGTRLVTARAGALPDTPSSFPLEYAGPGRDAFALQLFPAEGSVSASDAVPLSATAVDSLGGNVSDLLVGWTTSDPSMAIVTANGAASAELRGTGKRGSVTVTASTPTGLTASRTLTLVPTASRLVVVAGAGQTGIAGRALAQPFVVELQSGDGGPVPKAMVEFRAINGGSVTIASALTDVLGRASTSIVPGTSAGTYQFEATAAAVPPVIVSATATPAPPAAIAIVSGDGQSGTAGVPLGNPLVVVVTDEFGAPVEGATVDWTTAGGFGSLDASQSLTDASGHALATYNLGGRAGVEFVRASLRGVADASVQFTLRSWPGVASSFRLVKPLPPSIPVGGSGTDTLRVQLTDVGGSAVAASGVVVTATGTLTPGSSPAISVSAASNAAGIVEFAVPPYVGPVGVVSIALTAPGFTTLMLPPIEFVTGSMARLRVKTQPSIATSSGAPLAVQPEVKLYDVGWNDVKKSGVTVTAYVASGGGSLSGIAVAVTDVSGTATFTDLAIAGSPGTQVLGFSAANAPDVQSDPITMTAAASAIESVAGWLAPTTAANGSALSTFKVRLVDASGQAVARAGVPITVSATALVGATPTAPLVGTLTRLTDANGVATFDDVAFSTPLGDYSLTAATDPSVLVLPTLTLVGTLTVTN